VISDQELRAESLKFLRLLLEWLVDRDGRDNPEAGRGEFIVPAPHGELRLSVFGLTVVAAKDTSDVVKSVHGKTAEEVFQKVVAVVDGKEWP